MFDWDAGTWAQVVAAVAAAVAAFFAWRSARASARAGALVVLSADRERLAEIRGIVVLWKGGGDIYRRNVQPDLRRLLRHTDDLPETRTLADASNVTDSHDADGVALREVERALGRVEAELEGKRFKG